MTTWSTTRSGNVFPRSQTTDRFGSMVDPGPETTQDELVIALTPKQALGVFAFVVVVYLLIRMRKAN